MKFVENVKTPTMILHGQADTRVPIPQAEEFYRALCPNGMCPSSSSPIRARITASSSC